ncbi:protein phosphatase 2C domain-containing protein [Streptomyces sp. NPDC057654]|uniref:protein phosphatase 2C domain-containing protein n=1 Tax=Streptomyces sp. NPDC057654 TaxID=3346196 RepID=UPI0036A51377
MPGVVNVAGPPNLPYAPDVPGPPHLPGFADITSPPRTSGRPDLSGAPDTAEASGLPETGSPDLPPVPDAGEAPHFPSADPPTTPGVGFVGDRPPTYEAEPTALPEADPADLGGLVPDTVLEGARCGAATVRAVSLRGDSARYRGEARRDALLIARFGSGEDGLVLVAVASGARAAPDAHRAARDACEWIGGAIGRSQERLVDDIRAGHRSALESGLHRLTDRSYGRLRARAHELGRPPAEYSAALRCLLLPADPKCGTRVFFGVGDGGLFQLRGGAWQDLEQADAGQGSGGDRITVDLGVVGAGPGPAEPFRFQLCSGLPGDALLLCTPGLADPLRGEPAFGERLAERWSTGDGPGARPPGLAAFLADAQLRVKGYADDRTACVVWEA